MGRTHRFLGGVAYGYANQILVIAVSLWLTPFLLERLGQQHYGLWVVATQIIAYLMLFDFGIISLLPRETAYAMGRAGSVEAAGIDEIFGNSLRIVLLQIPILVFACISIWFFLPSEWNGLSEPLILLFLGFLIFFPLRAFQAVLQGLQELSFLGRLQTLSWISGTTVTVLFVLSGFGLTSLVLGWIFQQFSFAIVAWRRVYRRFPSVLPSKLPQLNRVDFRNRLGRGFWVSLAQVAQVLLSGTEVLIIGKFLGPAAVVPYAITAKLTTVLANQPQMIMQAASAGLSQMKTGEARDKLFQVSGALTQAMLLLSGAVICLIMVVNEGFVAWWIGSKLYGGFLLTLLLVMLMLFRHWNTTTVYSLFCFGYERHISLVTLLDGAVTLVLSSLLIWKWGPIGAPAGSLAGVLLVSLPRNLKALAHECGVSIPSIIHPLAPWFLRFLLIFALSCAIAMVWFPDGVLDLILSGAGITLAYFLIMIPLILKSPLEKYIRPLLQRFRPVRVTASI